MKRNRQQGVALVITLILLSVITFTAITFLVLSRREKGAVSISTDQAIAKLAAETGVARAQVEALSRIMATTNKFAYDLAVSTNYINSDGFDASFPGGLDLVPYDRLLNASYDYPNGQPINDAGDQQQAIANLYYNPRPPVYIFTNRAQIGTPDFRFYLDLNRNGRFDTNGVVVEFNDLNQPVLDETGSTVSNRVVGDPEWIGILENPDLPHGPDNRFVSRYATVLVPAGKTLDLNAVHNQSLRRQNRRILYRRNMGVGTWEINLAAFLTDLNTNYWTAPDDERANRYVYDPLASVPDVRGVAFEDAQQLISYRYAPNDTPLNLRPWRTLRPYSVALGSASVEAFKTDLIDGFGAGPRFLTDIWPPAVDNDTGSENRVGWPGDDNVQHYFAPGDLHDVTKTAIATTADQIEARLTFSGRLYEAGLQDSTYNRYTFYRLLSQLSMDGGPERSDKININYDNRNPYWNGLLDPSGVASVTNFVGWTPLGFFVEAGDALLKDHAQQLKTVRARNNAVSQILRDLADEISITNIPVMIRSDGADNFVYTASMNRLLQLAANIVDATTNRNDQGLDFPSVFRPEVQLIGSDLFITGWRELDDINGKVLGRIQPKDPYNPIERATIIPGDNVYGVPWIVGAKKGFPNFNELSIQNIFEVTRKLELSKTRATDLRPNRTNQMFLISINSHAGVEAWNSYRDDFTRPVTVYATNQLDIMVYMTNLPSRTWTANGWRNKPVGRAVGVPSWTGTQWPAVPSGDPDGRSFLAAVRTNFNVITNSIFRADGTMETQLSPAYDPASINEFPIPDITLGFTNRLQFVMVDQQTGRVLDYVQLRIGDRTNLSEIISSTGDRTDRRMWNTNRLGGDLINNTPEGLINQIFVSSGMRRVDGDDWRNYGFGQASGQSRTKAQTKFRDFITGNPGTEGATNQVMQAPFTPTRRVAQYKSWQANDPLVHYTAGDLAQLRGTGIQPLSLAFDADTIDSRALPDIGRLNTRYEPWGGNPSSSVQGGSAGRRRTDFKFKDSLVRSSDNWEFPTNKFPNVGWLGRVHRGTPWQTLYLKAGELGRREMRQWRDWTGNKNIRDMLLTLPQEDRRLFELFTAAFSENATTGQLSVNQTNLAAWSAVLSGVIALTNTTPDESWQTYSPTVVITNDPVVIPPAGTNGFNAPLGLIVAGINEDRSRQPNGVFPRLGDILQSEELTQDSPFLNLSDVQREKGITDAMYERIPQQIMGLLRGDDQPRFVIYSYGQTLKPAERSIVPSGTFFGMCTNYQITAEVATRSVVRVEGAPNNPRVVLESFNVLPPD